MYLGIAGKATSGKDTIAKIIKELLGEHVIHYNLADPLKNCINDWLGWGQEHGWGSQKEVVQAIKPDFRELVGYIVKHFPDHCTPAQAVKVMEVLSSKFEQYRYRLVADIQHQFVGAVIDNSKDVFVVSPRQVYQWFGTEGMRETVSNTFWLDIVPTDELVVIPDIRFEDEASFVRDGGALIHVYRDNIKEVAAHSSEAGVLVIPEDFEIENNGSMQELFSKVKNVLIELEIV